MAKPIPDGYHTVTPHVVVKDARKTIEFLKKALGAEELSVLPMPGGKGVMHAEVRIGDSIVMLGEEMPQAPCKSAETFNGSPVSFFVYVPDVDAAFRKAVAAGGVAEMPVQDMFWGDRTGSFHDPFGHSWTLATHTRDLTPEEISKGAETFAAAMAGR